MRHDKYANESEGRDKRYLNDFKCESVLQSIKLQEPMNLQQRIRHLTEELPVNNVLKSVDFERVIKESNDGHKMMKMKYHIFAIEKTPN